MILRFAPRVRDRLWNAVMAVEGGLFWFQDAVVEDAIERSRDRGHACCLHGRHGEAAKLEERVRCDLLDERRVAEPESQVISSDANRELVRAGVVVKGEKSR